MPIFSFLDAAASSPTEAAVVADGSLWTFAELADPVRRALGWLHEQGVGGNDEVRVAVVATTSFPTLTLLYALLEVGASIVLIHPRATPVERERLLATSKPDLIVLDAEQSVARAHVEFQPTQVPDERAMAIIHTS